MTYRDYQEKLYKLQEIKKEARQQTKSNPKPNFIFNIPENIKGLNSKK